MRTRLPLAALAAVLLTAAAASPAVATVTQRIDYEVVIAGSADYNRADIDGEASAQHDETIDFHTRIPKLSFYGNAAERSTLALGTASVRRGSYTITGPSAVLRCAEHTLTDSTGGGLEATWQEDRTVFAARVIDAFTVRIGGCPAPMGAWEVPFGSDGDPVGVGIFDGAFTLPHGRIGEASMTFPLSGAVTGTSCPWSHFNTVLCSLTWDATVTFTRIGEAEEELEVPLVPIGPKPAPPAGEDDDLLVPLVAKASLARSLASASLPLTCAADCRGTLVAKVRGKRLAKRAFAAEAGETRVTVGFDRGDRRVIRRAGGVRLTLRAAAAGQALVRSVMVRTR